MLNKHYINQYLSLIYTVWLRFECPVRVCVNMTCSLLLMLGMIFLLFILLCTLWWCLPVLHESQYICHTILHAFNINCFPFVLLSAIYILGSSIFKDSFAILSTSSFPWIPTCAGTHRVIIPICLILYSVIIIYDKKYFLFDCHDCKLIRHWVRAYNCFIRSFIYPV